MFTFKKNATTASSRVVRCFVSICFLINLIVPSPGFAQALGLPQPGTILSTTPVFYPAMMVGLEVYPDNPFKFDFIINDGDEDLAGDALKQESEKMIKYFLASLTIPEKDLWVNLSPFEQDRIIPDTLAQTDLGRDLLAQDYILKQLTASLIHPQTDLGKKFWDKVYQKAYAIYQTTEIPVDTFNKVWIMPDKVVVYRHGNMAFVAEASLKVMLEEDYVALQAKQQADSREHAVSSEKPLLKTNDQILTTKNTLASDIVREIVIPELEKEVNTGKNFASLRQAYNALILGAWFKKNLKESLLGKVYVNRSKVAGIDLEDKEIKKKIYESYLLAYKQGAYNFIRAEYDDHTKRHIPRKYFSGGIDVLTKIAENLEETTSTSPQQQNNIVRDGDNTRITAALSTDKNSNSSPLERSSGQWERKSWHFILEDGANTWSQDQVKNYLLEKYAHKSVDVDTGEAPKSPVIMIAGDQRYVAIAPRGYYKALKNPTDRWIVYIYQRKVRTSSSLSSAIKIPYLDGKNSLENNIDLIHQAIGQKPKEVLAMLGHAPGTDYGWHSYQRLDQNLKQYISEVKIPYDGLLVSISKGMQDARWKVSIVDDADLAVDFIQLPKDEDFGSAMSSKQSFEAVRSIIDNPMSSAIILGVPEGTMFPISILEGQNAQDLYDRLARKPIVADYEIAQLPEDLGKKLVGGKSYQLALMWVKDPENNFRIASVTSTFAEEFIKSDPELLNFIYDQIGSLNSSDSGKRERAAQEIRARIKNTPVPETIKKAIVQVFHEFEDVLLAVRSSGRAEDVKLEEIPEMSATSIGASAGQHDSYLGVGTPEETIERWRDNVASLYTDRATDYRDGMMVYAAFGALFKEKAVDNIVKVLKSKDDDKSKIVAKALEDRNIKIISSLTLYNALLSNGFSREAKLVQEERERFMKIENISMGVTLMPMADAEVSFVLFGADLSSGWTAKDFMRINNDQHFNEGRVFTITTNYKLGESIVQGIAMPDTYVVHVIREGKDLKVNILSRQLGTKKIQAVYKQPMMSLLGLREEDLRDFVDMVEMESEGKLGIVLAERMRKPVEAIEAVRNALRALMEADIDKTIDVEIYKQEEEIIQRNFGYDRQGLNKLAHLLKEVIKDPKTKTVFTDVDEERQNVFAATDSQIIEIAKEGMRKAEQYGHIVDMEGVLGHNFGKPNRVVTVQRRPSNAEVDVSKPNLIEINYTYVSDKDVKNTQAKHQHIEKHQDAGIMLGETLVNGFSTRNAFSGQLYVVDPSRSLSEQFDEIKEIAKTRKVIVRTRETTPDYIPILKLENVVGVIADMGGPTSHAAVVSRELGIATVVGIEAWLSKLAQAVGPRKAEQIRKYLNTAANVVTVDANANEDTGYGTIYAGELPISRRDIRIDVSRLPKVFTKIGYIMGMPHPMLAMSKMGQYDGFSGVALMRGEFPYGEENIHPRAGVAYDHYLAYGYLMLKGDHKKARTFYDQLRDSERLALTRFINELNRRAAMRKAGVDIPFAEVEALIKKNLNEFGHAGAEAFLRDLPELARSDLKLIQQWFNETSGGEDVIGQMSEQIKGYLSYHEFFRGVHGGAVGMMAAANSRDKNTVVYRSIDFKKNEARSLIGAHMFDRDEEPATMIGERGGRWLLKPENQVILRNEIRMLLEQVDRGYTNLGFMFPFVSTPQELDKLMTILQDEEKKMSQELGRPVYLREAGQMIELPSNVVQAEDFAKILLKHQKEVEDWFKVQFKVQIKRKSFFSFGTNDLTQTTKGADRDNPEMKYLMNEAHPFVVESIRYVANVAKKYGIKCGLCGQALVNLVDRNPEAAEEILMILGATDGYAGTDYLGTEKAINLSARGTFKHGKVKDRTGKEILTQDFSSSFKHGAAARPLFKIASSEDLGQTYIGDFILIDNDKVSIDLQDDKIKAQIARIGAVLYLEDLPLAMTEFIEKSRVPLIKLSAVQEHKIKKLENGKIVTIDFDNQIIFNGEAVVEVQVPVVESKIKIVKEDSQPKQIQFDRHIKVSDFYRWLGIHPLSFLQYDDPQEREKLPQDIQDKISLFILNIQAKSAKEVYVRILRKFISDQIKLQNATKAQSIVFETSDMESDDFAQLQGGSHFVREKEINPPLGVAGLDALTRIDEFRRLFALELKVFKWFARKEYDISLQFNSVKIPDHLVQALKIMENIGFDPATVKLGMNTAWPGNYLFTEKFIQAGKLSFVTLDRKRLGQGYWAADIVSGKNKNVVASYQDSEVWGNLDTPIFMIKQALVDSNVSFSEVASSTIKEQIIASLVALMGSSSFAGSRLGLYSAGFKAGEDGRQRVVLDAVMARQYKGEDATQIIESVFGFPVTLADLYETAQTLFANGYAEAYAEAEKQFQQKATGSLSPTGGIDFVSLYKEMNIKTDDQGLPLAIQFQDVEKIHFNSLTPIIIQMVPAHNLPLILGFETPQIDSSQVVKVSG